MRLIRQEMDPCMVSCVAEIGAETDEKEADRVEVEIVDKSLAKKRDFPSLFRGYLRLWNDFDNVTTLVIDGQLEQFSSEFKSLTFRSICSLKNLQVLSLEYNGLHDFNIGNHVGILQRLRLLSLRNNSLTTLPVGLRHCQSLEEIDIRNNCFASLPFILMQMPALKSVLRFLNRLGISYQYIRTSASNRVTTPNTNEEVRSVRSLQDLACRVALASGAVFRTERSAVPEFVRESICSVRDFHQCHNCQQLDVYHAPREVIIFPADFLGMKLQPMSASICSVACAEAFIDRWDSPYLRPPATQNCTVKTQITGKERRRKRRPCIVS